MTQENQDSASLDRRASESQVRVRRHAGHGRRTYIVAAVFLFAAVIAGGVIGAGVAVMYVQRHGYPVPPQPDALRKAIVERMDESMRLSPEETKVLADVVAARMDEIEKIRQTSRSEIRAQFDGMRTDVEKVVGQERCRMWMADRERRMHNRRSSSQDAGGGKHHDRDR